MTAVDLRARIPAQRTPAPVRRSYTDLEGWRGLAALSVVAFHLYQTFGYGTFTGRVPRYFLFGIEGSVDMFFLLSAILLTQPFWTAALEGRKAVDTRPFLYRRLTRVVPLWTLVCLVCWSSRNFSLRHAQWRDLFEHLTFTQSLDSHRIFYTVGPGWSMSVEVFFYLFLAGLGRVTYVLARRLPGRRTRIAFLASVCVALAGVSELWKLYAYDVRHTPLDHWAWYFGFPAKLDIFALGMLLALLVAATDGRVLMTRLQGRVTRLIGVGLYCLLATQFLREGRLSVYWHTLSAVCLLLVLAPSVLAPAGRTVAVLSTRPLRQLGMITFSIYLWHEALLLKGISLGVLSPHHFFLSLALLLAVTLAVGWVSYWAIEWPGNLLRVLYDGKMRKRDYYEELPAFT